MGRVDDLDSILLDRLNGDDYSAFCTLYERHIGSLYAYAKRINMDMEDAEDAIQDIFASIWIRRCELDIVDLKSWLHTSLRRQMLYRLRKRKYHEQFEGYLTFFQDEYKSENDIINNISYKELLDEINRELETLSPQKKKVFILSRFHNKSHKEIANDLNISELTVKKQINTVLKTFRKKFSYKSFFTFLYSLLLICATL